MVYTIENEYVKASVKQKGAELCSLQWLADNTEFIYNGSEWNNHAPLLFPIIGNVKDNEYVLEGHTYPMKKHGLLRNNPNFEVSNKKAGSITFRIASDHETKESYPFHFEFLVTYRLEGSTLYTEFKIHNKNNRDMPFSLGGHPAFKCPFSAGEAYGDYYLLFDQVEFMEPCLLGESGLVSTKRQKVFEQSNIIYLHKHLFDNDALILKKLKSREVKLKHKNSRAYVSVQFPDFDFLGLWAKPGADFICIEPWMGMADAENSNKNLLDKEGIRILSPNEHFSAYYAITVSK